MKDKLGFPIFFYVPPFQYAAGKSQGQLSLSVLSPPPPSVNSFRLLRARISACLTTVWEGEKKHCTQQQQAHQQKLLPRIGEDKTKLHLKHTLSVVLPPLTQVKLATVINMGITIHNGWITFGLQGTDQKYVFFPLSEVLFLHLDCFEFEMASFGPSSCKDVCLLSNI